ncbi:hypothetical protein ACLGI4_23555 [Streptomyces sp. HMX112]|uniref:hypothetical protein n=1 Tax=Streptomyces sp. HMX112 TaxID=3390850 RepID=UPI003A800A26
MHRLTHDAAAVVPRPLVDAYGAFTHRVAFDELSALITGMGHTVEPDDDASTTDDVKRYRVSGTGTRIFVIADVDPYGYGDVDPEDPTEQQVGDVWSISVSPAWWSMKN